MGAYSAAAEFYDLLYEAEKDYGQEADLVADLVRTRRPGSSKILDVGCGTGAHARELIDRGFTVHGIDIEPAFVASAREKCPEGEFTVADMRTMDLGRRYDAVTCLFSAIGYVVTVEALRQTVARMAEHLVPGGVLLVDPWFTPGEMDHGYVLVLTAADDGRSVVRMSRTVIEGTTSTLEFEYLVGTSEGLERRSEVHQLGLFTPDEMEGSFVRAGLEVERIERALRTRGIYVGVKDESSDEGLD